LPQNWALSGQAGGSPGVAESDFATHYDGWRWDYFTSNEIPTGSLPNLPAAPSLDPDGDGMSNLAEYAFGLNPKLAEGGPKATCGIVNDSGASYLALTFACRHKALDLTYTVEATSDLATWTPVATQIGPTVDLGGGVDQVTIRDSQPYQASVPRYMHVRAVK
jgi:hypothetical protein